MAKRYLTAACMVACLAFLSLSCTKKEHHYNDAEKSDLMRRSTFVVTAAYKEKMSLKEGRLVDAVEDRPGFSNKMQYGIVFKIKSFLKGDYGKDEIIVGVNMPSTAFGITPGEYPGQKIYTLYVGESPKYNRNALIGAEWEEITYS